MSQAAAGASHPAYASLNDDVITVGTHLSPLTSGPPPAQCPAWPPDVFALTASLLQHSGAYTRVVGHWPPAQPLTAWADYVSTTGKEWRKALNAKGPVPALVQDAWTRVLAARAHPLRDLCNDTLCEDLLFLLATADEASEGIGLPPERDAFERAAMKLLHLSGASGATLCATIPRQLLRVLPKLHTPQTGLSIRSLSHHLALCPGGDLDARWYNYGLETDMTALNLLLVPWPLRITPKQFRPANPPKGSLRQMPERYGFFEFDPSENPDEVLAVVQGLLARAQHDVGKVHGIVLPELAIRESSHEALADLARREGAFLICGVASPGAPQCPGGNTVRLNLPVGPSDIAVSQKKHHRWRLDRNQIRQYGLGGALDPTRLWWEHCACDNRQLSFVAMLPWFTLCVLLCEDLARQEPVAEIVRAVGPNLVVALLLDGPQLAARWPARYATVLADDPGSSVLTLTSLGMSMLSRSPQGAVGSRVIALWKDAQSGNAQEIQCPPDAHGVVLCITADRQEEWSADGRSDHKTTGYAILSGYHAISLPQPPTNAKT